MSINSLIGSSKENELNKKRKIRQVEEQRVAMQVFEQQQAMHHKSEDEQLLKDVVCHHVNS